LTDAVVAAHFHGPAVGGGECEARASDED
jgi:hypothetical protein